MHKNILIPLLCQYGLFIDTCVSKNVIVSKEAIFYLLWYNVIRWRSHTFKKSSFLSFYSFYFRVWHKFMEWKMPLTGFTVNLLFFVILFYIERKILERKLATILLLNFNLSGKFQRFNDIGGSIKMLKNSWISKNFN